mmetsp:Transcript_63275/g.142694  ORF Transcript_63275/g.142694 Transcript_63275/m.142694 type:complete len:225 (+) Transcript_63275:554-1228(+)
MCSPSSAICLVSWARNSLCSLMWSRVSFPASATSTMASCRRCSSAMRGVGSSTPQSTPAARATFREASRWTTMVRTFVASPSPPPRMMVQVRSGSSLPRLAGGGALPFFFGRWRFFLPFFFPGPVSIVSGDFAAAGLASLAFLAEASTPRSVDAAGPRDGPTPCLASATPCPNPVARCALNAGSWRTPLSPTTPSYPGFLPASLRPDSAVSCSPSDIDICAMYT